MAGGGVELVGAKLTHTPADGGRDHIHLLAARLHSNKVESRPAHITTGG